MTICNSITTIPAITSASKKKTVTSQLI
uniref:Uncharacterized protein n=1 Tax=Rhizophora mucronata TaxID=61149 RepID=A0A2P2NAN6_RHIMU